MLLSDILNMKMFFNEFEKPKNCYQVVS